jgi:hypothetical protein
MHRGMIEQVNAALGQAGDPAYPRVEGWSPIPWRHDDPDWPMPVYEGQNPTAKAPETTANWQRVVAEGYENRAWLQTFTVDRLGTEIERGIHNWIHMHWAAAPWYRELPGQDPDDPRNDFLGSTYSSHVNKAF